MPEISSLISDIFGGVDMVDGQIFVGICSGAETALAKHTHCAPAGHDEIDSHENTDDDVDERDEVMAAGPSQTPLRQQVHTGKRRRDEEYSSYLKWGVKLAQAKVKKYAVEEEMLREETKKLQLEQQKLQLEVALLMTQVAGKAWLERMDEKHKARKEAVHKACMEHFNISLKSERSLAANPSKLRPLIVNDDHHFIYSIVYKVGSSNWERVLVEDLGGFKNVPNQKLYSHKALHWIRRYNSTQIESRLNSYKIFIFVRNPLARILSAYRDKFVDHRNSVFTRMGQNIIMLYRDHNQVTSGNVTFTEFVKYLVDSPAHRSNPHWKPIFNQNFPCEINFDFIGKLEEASDDIPYVLKSLQIDHLVKYKQGQPKKTPEKNLLAMYYSQLPQELLQKLCAIYKADFVIFGYDIPDSFS
ncbi:carbohydrate sulfotransferase 11-like isoform X2 [Asterias amurensis]